MELYEINKFEATLEGAVCAAYQWLPHNEIKACKIGHKLIIIIDTDKLPGTDLNAAQCSTDKAS